MIPKKEVNFFIRFLKDKGLYYAFLKDLRRSEPLGKDNFHKFIKERGNGYSAYIIMDCILWSESLFTKWQDMYHEYIEFFSKEYGK
jgi:hypothetical protein